MPSEPSRTDEVDEDGLDEGAEFSAATGAAANSAANI